ncbi:acetyl-CoA synthetase-like protein [Xylariaceae sp. FL1651]|nr:acetyl-CoA synthetase-like protein [Xylariaceae sp. FL1651]
MTVSEEQSYGRRLMPLVLDKLARAMPSKLFATIPNTADLSDGFRDISFSDMARCINFMARWIEDSFGRSDSFETLAYIGIPDLRGVVIFYAAVKCGYKLLIPSPRNPSATTLSLLGQTSCSKLVHTAEVAPLVKPLVNLESGLRCETLPSFDHMLDSNPAPYPYEKDFGEAENEPVLVLHSSGSTGLPKPITMTHGSFAVMDNDKNLPEIPGRKRRDWSMWNFEGEARVYSIFPFFHLGGFMSFAFNPVLNNASPVLGPPFMLPDGNLLRAIKQHNKLRSIILPPSIVEQIVQEPNGIEIFQDVDFLISSGAPISPAVGERLSPVIEIRQPYGSTEMMLIPELDPGRNEWAYHEFNPHYRHEMQLYDPNEQTYEFVVLADDSDKYTTAVYHNLPGVKEYHTKDLFTQHPEKPNLYKYYGRCDDIIVLANGHKLNPLPMESKLQSRSDIKGAIVVGNRRSHTLLLVEPRDIYEDVTTQDAFLQNLWPFVENCNSLIAGQGRIQRGHVVCAVPERPFIRTGKGTIVRKLSEELYKGEIEELYSSSSSSQEASTSVSLKPTLKPVFELPAVAQFLREILALSFAPAATISEDEDFFAYGLDSVQTLEIASNLRRNLKSVTSNPVMWITPRTIFHNSTLADLSNLLRVFLNDGVVPEERTDLTQAQKIDEAVKKHIEALPKTSAPCITESKKPSSVALIGSTGYIGIHVFAALLKDPDITHIYCLNRSSDAQQRQEAALPQVSSSEDVQSLAHKVEYMTIAFGKPYLGLSETQYHTLVEEVDVIMYNAWKLDFGLSLRSFDPFLKAMRDIVEISITGARSKHIIFVSSLSSVGNLSSAADASADVALRGAPESLVEDALAPLNFGYAQSKHVAERILAAASRQSGIPVSIVRVGQVGGSINEHGAAWPEQRWISALLRTAKTMGCMPNHVALIDWIPVESVAAVLGALIVRPTQPDTGEHKAEVFHIYPTQQPSRWELLVDIMRKTYGVTETLPLREWTKKLRSVAENATTDDIARMPALKVLDFYEATGDGLENVQVDTDRVVSFSGINIPPATEQLVDRWLRDWKL